jgi:DNA-binding winged helix-turn-helix (wHTH) protein
VSFSKESRSVYEFGPFRFDPLERLLLRDGKPVQLAPRVFDTLLALIENSGRLVGKEELMSKLWPDTFVEEATLARNISDLRKALGESTGNHKFIETVPKRGYRFTADVKSIGSGDVSVFVQRHIRSRIVVEEQFETGVTSISQVYVDSYYLASAYAALGKKQEAIAELEEARRERSCWLSRLRVDPLFDGLRHIPAFEDVLMSVGGDR